MANNPKIIKYRKPFKINIGIIIFLILFLYILFSAYTNLGRNKISFYEVTEGGMAKDTEHLGIAVREEQIQYAQKSGYVSFFVSAKQKVAVGTPVYCIDDTGALSEILSRGSDITLNEDSVRRLKKKLADYSKKEDDNDFRRNYDLKNSVNSMAMELANIRNSDNTDQLIRDSGIAVSKVVSPAAGIVSMTIDGYEERAPESITGTDFSEDEHAPVHVKSGQLIEGNSPVYKVITSENWSIIFPVSEEERTAFSEKSTLKVSFRNTDITCSAPYTQMNSTDGKTYGKLTFDKYMVNFADDRYIHFDLEADVKEGLKIPKNAVVTKPFLIVPVEYAAKGGDGLQDGFYKQIYGENGTTVQFIPTELFYQTDRYYYINFSSSEALQPGDQLVKPGSTETYKLGATENLNGVYNINKGYAVFKQIEILDSNEEYYTVKKNQKYGLSVYDHILIDPEGINEGDFIYQ